MIGIQFYPSLQIHVGLVAKHTQITRVFLIVVLFLCLRQSFNLVNQAVAWSQLTATSASQVQVILLPQPPESLGL